MSDISIKEMNAINKFLHKNKILSICTSGENDIWAANCLFTFNEDDMCLFISTKKETRHAKIMTDNIIVVGTMYSKFPLLFLKQGIQYKGRVILLNGRDVYKAKEVYLKKYPLFKNKTHDIWKIFLDEIKFTDMKMGRIKNTTWIRI
ncbi:MAG: hypothetical protein JKY55_06375 [Aliivibrio sp.]|uniref:hypothetical protein n=1 Tax=Aliivibrio sp. TaxID=1872443 RepID=UPI001A5683E8|nr:hypothetical protein [Aliivibrio sp.]